MMAAPDRLDFSSPVAVRAWLEGLTSSVRDLVAVAQDMAEPPGRRDLGRRIAATLVEETSSALATALEYAFRGLEDDPDPSDPAGMPHH